MLECIADWPTCHAEAPCLLFEEGTPIAWPRDTPADEWGSGVAIGHLDDDGRLDIVSGAPDGLWVSWGRGGGTSARLSHDERLAHVAAVTIIDADGDGQGDQCDNDIDGDGMLFEGSFGYHFYTFRAMLPMLQARGMTTFGDVLEETRKHGRLLEDLN